MGWFITQSLAFIIIAALIGLGAGLWIGWIVWGGRAKGRHAAEKAEAARAAEGARAEAAAGAAADARGADEAEDEAAAQAATAAVPAAVPAAAEAATDTADGAGPETVADTVTDTVTDETAPGTAESEAAEAAEGETTEGGTTADPSETATAAGSEAGDDAPAGTEAEIAAAESDVVAEAEAVARAAAEASAEADAAEEGAAEADAADKATDAAPAADPEPAPADDLQRIEGVGPKIAAALAAAGYTTYAAIAAASESELRAAVAGQGIRFAPSASTWADQASYLVDGDAEGLDEFQDYLVGGQERRAKFDPEVDYTDVDEIDGAAAKAAALAEDEARAAEPEPQDLQRIEGIGPKIEAVLQAAGVTTYARLAASSEEELREVLAGGGITFAPAAATWADQARYLVDGDEAGLEEYQDYLVGGQERRAKFNPEVDYTDVDEIDGAAAKAAALAEDEARAADEAAAGDAGPTQPGVTA